MIVEPRPLDSCGSIRNCRILWALTQKVNEAGWIDDYKDRAKGTAFCSNAKQILNATSERWPGTPKACPSRPSSQSCDHKQKVTELPLYNKRVKSHVLYIASMPPKIKQEIMAMIRQYLEKQVEG